MIAPSLVTSASSALLCSPHFAIRRLEIETGPQGLILRGRVHSYYLKQMAQETLRPFLGENGLVNQIDVTK